MHALSGIRSRDLSNQAAADLRVGLNITLESGVTLIRVICSLSWCFTRKYPIILSLA
jgi:hypothetical protein